MRYCASVAPEDGRTAEFYRRKYDGEDMAVVQNELKLSHEKKVSDLRKWRQRIEDNGLDFFSCIS